MIDEKHPQLDPQLNRTRVKYAAPLDRPKDTTEYPPVDPKDPYRNVYLGIYDTPVTGPEGETWPMCCYIPTTERSAWNMVLVLVPGGVEPRAFLEEGRWRETLEKHEMTGFFLGAPDGWDREKPGAMLEIAVRALGEMRANRLFQSNAPGIYCLGFEDGAWLAALFAVTHVSVLAAWGALGDTGLEETLLRRLGDGPSDCDPGKARRTVSLPACVLDDRESNVVRYFREACRTADQGLRNDTGRVYLQQEAPGESYRGDTVCAQVWHGSATEARKKGLPAVAETLVAFVEGYKRWGAEGNGDLRRTIYPERIGMKKTVVEVDGRQRYWLTYEPTAYREGRKKKFPLVLAIHGFTCSGEFFANNTGWNSVGEERDVIVVYPTAYPWHRGPEHPRGSRFPTQEWNAGGFSDGLDPAAPDELSYFRTLLEETLKTYPIDPSRIYVTGHSNGAMMTQCLMRYMPEVFAGFAPVGFMEDLCGNMQPEPADGIARNVWYVVGEYDGAGCAIEEGNVNVRTIRKLCQHNHTPYENRRYYETGIYMHSLWRNEQGVPLVRFTGIKNWPHTYTPEVAFMIYDEHFARYVRHEDGTLEYLA